MKFQNFQLLKDQRSPIKVRFRVRRKIFQDIAYNLAEKRLYVGTGYIDNVTPEMWNYEVSGKQIVKQWFRDRQKDRSRPVMGDRREPSKLNDIQPDYWIAEYTTDLINLLNVLGLLIELEPKQAELLEKICDGPQFTVDQLNEANALVKPPAKSKKKKSLKGQKSLLD